jgi:hypothetical protein
LQCNVVQARHAGISRKNGITREAFLERMESDIRAIQAFPPDLRWFVEDREDWDLLLVHLFSAARQH